MAYGLLITIGVMAAALVFVAITRRAAQPPVVVEVTTAAEEAPASSAAATVPAAAAAGTIAMAIRTAVRTAMCDVFATRANWPSCEAGSTSVGLATGRVIEGETLYYLWFVKPDLMVRCYRTINPTYSFLEGDWGLTQSALAEEIGVYQASISSDGVVELPQQFHSDINRLLLEEVNAA